MSSMQSTLTSPAAADIIFLSGRRCELVQSLLAAEKVSPEGGCHALDYEKMQGTALLESSPGYWAKKLPQGYLRTVPTTRLIQHFASFSPLLAEGTRLALVFGGDLLGIMTSWNKPDELFQNADLVILGRAAASLKFAEDPAALLSSFRNFDVRTKLSVKFQDHTLFGAQQGCFLNHSAAGDATFFLLPALEGQDQHLSSTSIRNNIADGLDAIRESIAGGSDTLEPGDAPLHAIFQEAAGRDELLARLEDPDVRSSMEYVLDVLDEHGYQGTAITALFEDALSGSEALQRVFAEAQKHGQVVKCNGTRSLSPSCFSCCHQM
jgi:nicotinic acid mononucleotide adenylyltransferase